MVKILLLLLLLTNPAFAQLPPGSISVKSGSSSSTITGGSTPIASCADGRILFDDAGVTGCDADLTWNKTTNTLGLGLVNGAITTGNILTVTSGAGLVLDPGADADYVKINSNAHNGNFRQGSDTFNGDVEFSGGNGTWIFATDSVGYNIEFREAAIPIFGVRDLSGTSSFFVRAGETLGLARVPGSIFSSITTTGNLGAGEDDLFSYSSAAGLLATDLDSTFFEVAGTFAANVNNKRIRVRTIEGANNTVVFDSGAAAINGGEWILRCTVIRSGATTLKSACALNTSSATLSVYTDYATGTFTFANAGTVKITAEATADNDIVAEFWKGSWSPAP